jgi:hypothetical protein
MGTVLTNLNWTRAWMKIVIKTIAKTNGEKKMWNGPKKEYGYYNFYINDIVDVDEMVFISL